MSWQPIETAPKDWVPVLVWAVSEEEREDADDEEREPKRQILIARHSRIQPGQWWLWGGSLCAVFSPTHWMPLPPPPTEQHTPASEIAGAVEGEG